jgi:subtilase family serine protease
MNRANISLVLTVVLLSSGFTATPTHGGNPVAAAALRGCAAVAIGDAACLSVRAVTSAVAGQAVAMPTGLSPVDIRSAYNLTAGGSATVAVVTAYDDPKAESDLAVYRAKFKLRACTTANRCFRKVNQSGGTASPRVDAGWAGEASLDIEMVSAACTTCRILLVEANTSSMADLAAAADYAATQKVSAISNSYVGSDTTHAAAYNHPGVAVVASAGDNGYGAGAPASYATVIAVGGTSLRRSSNARGWTETAWSGSGSRCATGTAKPAWQTALTKCAGKALADVSAVADPRTGVAAYIGTRFGTAVGWQVMGGTSVAAPIIAGVYGLSRRTSGYPAAYTWAHSSSLNDVTSGSNGKCATSRWCSAGKGWDGPTGLGTPNGTSSF